MPSWDILWQSKRGPTITATRLHPPQFHGEFEPFFPWQLRVGPSAPTNGTRRPGTPPLDERLAILGTAFPRLPQARASAPPTVLRRTVCRAVSSSLPRPAE